MRKAISLVFLFSFQQNKYSVAISCVAVQLYTKNTNENNATHVGETPKLLTLTTLHVAYVNNNNSSSFTFCVKFIIAFK